MRFALLALALAACNAASATTQPGNLVCSRIAIVNPKAACVPELTDVGERHTHTAIVSTDEGKVACALNDATLSLVCDALVFQPKPESK